MKDIRFRVWMNDRFAYWGFVRDAAGSLIFAGLMQSNMCPLSMEEQRERSEQFTGLIDRNGKEIWEGDMLGNLWQDGYIGYCDKCKSFEYFIDFLGCMACGGNVQWFELIESDDLEVIGNIHENLELMEGKKDE